MTDDTAVCQVSHANIDLAMTCSICFGTYKTPKHLSCCSHSFCLPCLEDLVKSDGTCWNVVCCPQCRTKSPLPFGGVRYFQTNIALQQIVEAWQSHPSKSSEKQSPVRRCSESDVLTATALQDERRLNAETFLAAARNGDVGVVCRMVRKCGRVLFSERTDDDAGSTGLHLAVKFGHVHLVKTMLKMDAWIGTPDNKDNTALHYAARYGQDEIAALLVKSGFEVDVVGELSRTPFLTAAAYGHAVIVRLLLSNGANMFAVDMYGASAALLASFVGSIAVLHELVLFGGDFTTADHSGNVPLFVASAQGHVEVVAMLLNTEAGLLIDQRGYAGQTALHAASTSGNIEVAKLLILHRASMMLLDGDDCTPLDVAKQRGHLEFVEVITDFATKNGYVLKSLYSGELSLLGKFRSEEDSLRKHRFGERCWFHNSSFVP